MKQRLGRFRVQKTLGKGSFGEAFLALDPEAEERLVVLKKVTRKSGSRNLELLRREFATLSRLAHPNIARVYEMGRKGAVIFLVEEFIQGKDLYAATRGANYNQILAAVAQVLRALHYLHQQRVIHGDLKPENILVAQNSSLFSPESVKLIDFGLAATLEEVALDSLPSGTLCYMAPEVLLERPMDHRVDLYALGVCLYQILTGTLPFPQQEGRVDLMVKATLEARPVEPARFQPDLPRGLNTLTLRLLEKSPEDRYPDAAAALAELNRSEDEHYALFTAAEWRLHLRDGALVGRQQELEKLKTCLQSGERCISLSGPSGAGKSRLAREFRRSLQIAGEEDEALTFQEYEDSSPPSAMQVMPWTAEQLEGFLLDRFRVASIPGAWLGYFSKESLGLPGRVIGLAEFLLHEGLLQLQGDRAILQREAPPHGFSWEEMLRRNFASLEADRRRLLELCAFAHEPLSLDVLQRITAWPRDRLEELLAGLEKQGWIRGVLYNGNFLYRVEEGRIEELFGTGVTGESLEDALALIEQIHREGHHLRARRLFRGLPVEEKRATWTREQLSMFYAVGSLICLEAGELDRAQGYCEQFLRLPKLSPLEMGKIHNLLGWIHYRQGNYESAKESLNASLDFWRRAKHPEGEAAAYNYLGMTYQALAQWPEAQREYRAAAAVVPEHPLWQARIQMNLGTCTQAAGDFVESLQAYRTAREWAERAKDPRLESQLLNNLANLYLYFGRMDAAKEIADRSLRLAIEHGLSHLEGQDYLLLSTIADKEGNREATRDYLEKASRLYGEQGTRAEQALVALHQAYRVFSLGEVSKVKEILSEIRSAYPQEKETLVQCDLLEGKLAVSADPAALQSGIVALERAEHFYSAAGDRANLWDVFLTRGELLAQHRPEEAGKYFQQALQILEALSQKIPEEYRGSFYRDRKREKIMAQLESQRHGTPLPTTEIPSPLVGEGGRRPGEGEGAMVRINRLLASEQNLDYLLETILDESLVLLQAERGYLLLLEAGQFKIKACRNIDRSTLEGPGERYSATVARMAAAQGKSLLVTDAQGDDRFKSAQSVIDLELRAVLAVPMKIGPELTGVIYVDNRFRRGIFDETHQKLLEGFADQAALALRNARQMEELRQREQKIDQLNLLLQDRLDKTEQEFEVVQEKYRLQQQDLKLKYSYEQIIGQSEKLQEVLKILDRVTDSDVTVLINGETGTGKELIARALHFNSPRKEHPFATENCAAFSETVLESELFGHKKGSFTGALEDRVGIFEAAEGGTVFLDEIGDMPLGMQAKLLRVLQERQVRAIGARDYQAINVRVLAATNKDLLQAVKEGKFREDLYYRINVVRVLLPPLRERPGDIPLLVEHLLKSYQREGQKSRVNAKAMERMLRYDWPGNIRELANEVQKCCSLGVKIITPELLSPKILEEKVPATRVLSLNQQVSNTEKSSILEALKKYRYSRTKTAKALGVSRITLYKKMKSYGIKV